MSKTRWLILSVLMDAALVNLGIIAAFYVRFGATLPAFNFQAYSRLAAVITVILVGSLYVYGLYEVQRTSNAWTIVSSIFQAMTLGVMLVVILTFFVGFFSFPRSVFALAWVMLIVLLSGWRVAAARLLKIKWPVQKVLIVGTGAIAQQLLEELRRRSQWGYEVIGLAAGGERETRELAAPVLGSVRDTAQIVRQYEVDRVIVTSPTNHREILEELARSDEVGVQVEVVPELYEIFMGTVDNLVSDIPLMELTRKPTPDWVTAAKRFIDIALALALLVLTLPAMAVVAVAVRLTSPGPVFYRQERVGKDERTITITKFRTMVAGAEKMTGPVLASARDERVTPVGAFLRRYRLDELPQLASILKGEMSFVGPRPERAFFVEEFKESIPGYRERFRVKPGVTGLAQVSGSYATTAENKLKYDLIYMYHQSLLMDLKILLETVRVVLTGRGAQ
ncbi:MAG: sugar transferase [Actinobacteria bacterium]|nr:MAG: sugar transferase [Actinomycetota bacterium]